MKLSQLNLAFLVVAFLACISNFRFVTAVSAAADPDTSFAGTGFLRAGLGPAANGGSAAVAQPDGKIVVAGSGQYGDNADFTVFRYNVDGSLDRTFGTNGLVTTTFGTANDNGTCVTIQGDGKIVVGGTSNDQFALVRYHPDGRLDASFGGDGGITAGEAGTCVANAITLQPDGRIVLAGSRVVNFAHHFGLVRFLPDGSLDLSFGSNGFVTTHFSWSEIASGVALQPDLKIVAVGQAYNGPGTGRILVARYNTDGSLDTSFDFDGSVTTPIGTYAEASAVAIQTGLTSDTKIVVAGIGDGFFGDDVAIVRYNLDGSLDTSFNGDGIVTTDLSGSDDGASSVLVQYQGANPTRIVVGGWATIAGYYDFAAARYTLSGELDATFSGDGVVTTPVTPPFAPAPDDYAAAMVRSLGKIVLVGSADMNPFDAAVVRYNDNGTLDTTFDVDGIRVDDAGSRRARGRDLLVQPDGKIVTTGAFLTYNEHDIAVFRCRPDGTPDSSFHGDGWTVVPVALHDEPAAIERQTDGKLLVAGHSQSGADTHVVVVRLNGDGTVDGTFGTGGVLSSHVAGLNVTVEDMILQPDGRILVAGSAWEFGFQVIVVARFESDGSPDTSFGTSGHLLFGADSGAFPKAVALQPDGKIVIAGTCRRGGYTLDFLLARLTAEGDWDLPFAENAIALTDMTGEDDYGRDLLVQPDGRILVAGHSENGPNQKVALARYNPDGTLDTTLDGDGIVLTPIDGTSGTVDGVALEANGHYLVAGAGLTNPNDVDLVRFDINGTIDPSYGDAGFATFDVDSGTQDEATELVLDVNGNAVLAGTSNGVFLIARILGEGMVSSVPVRPEIPGSLLNAGRAWPNPALHGSTVTFRTTASGPLSAVILDVAGRKIRTLGCRDLIQPGEHTLEWDGRDDSGNRASSGIYYLRIQQSESSLVRSITVLN